MKFIKKMNLNNQIFMFNKIIKSNIRLSTNILF